MSQFQYSFIIPVYNRPDEIRELLESMIRLRGDVGFEIVIVEDGSDLTSVEVVKEFQEKLQIEYFFKPNTGPGDSRNFGMSKANTEYFIILDSDVLLDSDYLLNVHEYLQNKPLSCFGGPDGVSEDFTDLQKAIDFSMTSVLTTGGVRGSESQKNYQPRSFNMGLSKEAFLASGGFGNIHPGEDPDLVFRLWKLGYKTGYIPKAIVYHKRRTSWSKFYTQVFKFGSVRPILNKWHPNYRKAIFWLPSLFLVGFCLAIIGWFTQFPYLAYVYLFYITLLILNALSVTRDPKVSMMAIVAVCIQFSGYGYGFLKSTIRLAINPKQTAQELFPNLFFK